MTSPHKEVLMKISMAKFQIMHQGITQLQEEVTQFPAHYQIDQRSPAGVMIEAVNDRLKDILAQAAAVTPQSTGLAAPPLGADVPAVQPDPEEDINSLLS